MLAYKYYCRPVDPMSEDAALAEIARYVEARNGLLRIKEKWARIKEDMILPEFRELAATHRATPRRGRKPAKVRADREELRAADVREAYDRMVSAGGSYATWWLADKASKLAKHPLRELAGRAGIMPHKLAWDGNVVEYCGTRWSLHRKQLLKRPIPADKEVVQAWLQRERTSTDLLDKPRYKWFLVLVIDGIDARQHRVVDDRIAAGLDLAWRQDEDTLRAAYVADEAGTHKAVRVPAECYRRLQHAESLQHLADSDANKLRAALGVPQNTSYRRLVELAKAFERPHEVRELSEHMIHLLDWRRGAVTNTLASRDADYVAQAQGLLRRYHTIYVEKIKATPALVQKASTRKKKSGPNDVKGGVARGQRQYAAPFSFLRTLQREAPKFQARVVEVDGRYTSQDCARCGADMGPGTATERMCQACGATWDQDHMAAINILRRGKVLDAQEVAAED